MKWRHSQLTSSDGERHITKGLEKASYADVILNVVLFYFCEVYIEVICNKYKLSGKIDSGVLPPLSAVSRYRPLTVYSTFFVIHVQIPFTVLLSGINVEGT